MIDDILFYSKLGLKLIKKDVVTKEDFREEYDLVAETYGQWLGEMGQHTDKIINTKFLEQSTEIKILDFACGTGYITKELLKKFPSYRITSVDQSEKMLQKLKDLNLVNSTIIQKDGLEFLKDSKEQFDRIYFGWALCYFDYHQLFPLFNAALKPGGTLSIITNIHGTLDKIEKIFLKAMRENKTEVVRPMDIKLNLPKDKKELSSWCKEFGFSALETGEGETVLKFKSPEELLDWLNITGAAAGTKKIFKDYDKVKPKIVEIIEKEKYTRGFYEINHKFAYGVFRKEL